MTSSLINFWTKLLTKANIGSYDAGRGRLFVWMVRVCCNHAVDTLRDSRHQHRRRQRPLEIAGTQQAPAAATFNPEDIGVRELTRGLKPRQRDIIELLYFQGHTQAEVAEQLGIPLGTVKTRAGAAMKALLRLAGPAA